MKHTFAIYSFGLLLLTAPAYAQTPQTEAARTMASLVAEFHQGMTLADWRKAHPDDRVEPFKIDPADVHRAADTDWCARASQTVQSPDGGSIQRAAYFFVPQRAPGQRLPAQDSDPNLVSTCTLQHLWVETTPPTFEDGAALGQQLRTALEQRFGAPEAKAEMTFLGAAAWEQRGKWKNGNALIASAYDQTIGGHGRKRVLALVTTPVADKYGFNFGITKGFDNDYDPTRELLRKVERVAGLEQQTTDIERFLDSTDPNRPGAGEQPCGSVAELAEILSRWMEAAKQWQGQRRTAALLVADLTMVASQACYQSQDDSTRARLKTLGAGLEYSQLGASWEYNRAWLREVVQTRGPIGEMAFVEWMRTGFREGCCCQGESPERVITEGEKYLEQKRAPETEARVHFMLADAYRDIVGLAGGAGQEYGDPSMYLPRAPEARLKAIAHYRTGLKFDSQSKDAQHAWTTAWRLIAGMGTSETRFFCVYD